MKIKRHVSVKRQWTVSLISEREKTANFIFFFLHSSGKENVKKTEKGKCVLLLHVLKIHRQVNDT